MIYADQYNQYDIHGVPRYTRSTTIYEDCLDIRGLPRYTRTATIYADFHDIRGVPRYTRSATIKCRATIYLNSYKLIVECHDIR